MGKDNRLAVGRMRDAGKGAGMLPWPRGAVQQRFRFFEKLAWSHAEGGRELEHGRDSQVALAGFDFAEVVRGYARHAREGALRHAEGFAAARNRFAESPTVHCG